MNKFPFGLNIGLLLMLLFIVIAIIGPKISPYKLFEGEKIRNTENGFISSPFKPDKTHIFGSDIYGFDILTNILNGASFTIFFCFLTAFARVLIGTIFAFFPGGNFINGKPKRTKQIRSLFFRLLHGFSSLPTLVFVYFILVNITFNSPLSPWNLAFFQGLVIILAGIPGTYSMMQGKISEIYRSEHVEAAISYGSDRVRVAYHHTLPFLVESLLLSLIRESIAVLVLIGQLGIFNVFIGGTIIQPDGLSGIIYLSRTFEWAGLIGYNKEYIFSGYWWIVLFPLAAYFGFLTTLHITLKGFENLFKKMIKHNSIL